MPTSRKRPTHAVTAPLIITDSLDVHTGTSVARARLSIAKGIRVVKRSLGLSLSHSVVRTRMAALSHAEILGRLKASTSSGTQIAMLIATVSSQISEKSGIVGTLDGISQRYFKK